MTSATEWSPSGPRPIGQRGRARRGAGGDAGGEAASGDARAALAEALSAVGDRWSLLLVWTLLDGPSRFSELLDATPGLAPSVLTQRLRRLVASGVVRAEPYSERPPRLTYRLTERGAALAGPAALLAAWAGPAGAWAPTHEACGSALEVRWYCPACDSLAGIPETEEVFEA